MTKDELKQRVDQLEEEIQQYIDGKPSDGVLVSVDLMERLIEAHGSNNPVDLRAIVQAVREVAEEQYPERWKR